RRALGLEPRRAPEIRHPFPSRKPRVAVGQRGERAFLRPHLIQRVVWRRLQRKTNWQRVTEGAGHLLVSKEWQLDASGLGRRTSQRCDPRAKQAVADLQAAIEGAERPIGSKRRQPE